MYKLINHIGNRKPLFTPLGIRDNIRETIHFERFKLLSVVEEKLIEFCIENQGREACAIAFVNRISNELVDFVVGDIGSYNKCIDPINHREYLRPNILQIVIHFHPNGSIDFSNWDNKTDNFRFFRRIDDWSYIISLGDNGNIIRSRIKNNTFF